MNLQLGLFMAWLAFSGFSATENRPSAGQEKAFVPGGAGRVLLLHPASGSRMRLIRNAANGVTEYCLQPGANFWGPIIVRMGRIPIGTLMVGAGPVFDTPPRSVEFIESRTDGNGVRAWWKVEVSDGRSIGVESRMELVDTTLIVEFTLNGPGATGVSLGRFEDLSSWEDEGDSGMALERRMRGTGVRNFQAASLLESASGLLPALPDRSSPQAWEIGAVRFVDGEAAVRTVTGKITIVPDRESGE